MRFFHSSALKQVATSCSTVIFPLKGKFLPLPSPYVFSPVSKACVSLSQPTQSPAEQVAAAQKCLESSRSNFGSMSREYITQLLYMAGVAQQHQSISIAAEYLEEATKIAGKFGDITSQAAVIHTKTIQYWHQSEWQQALDATDQHVALLQSVPANHHSFLIPLEDKALTQLAMREFDKAMDSFQAILAISHIQQTIGWNPYITALGTTELLAGKAELAEKTLKNGLIPGNNPLNFLGTDRIGQAVTLNNLAVTAATLGHQSTASAHLLAAKQYIKKAPTALQAVLINNEQTMLDKPQRHVAMPMA